MKCGEVREWDVRDAHGRGHELGADGKPRRKAHATGDGEVVENRRIDFGVARFA